MAWVTEDVSPFDVLNHPSNVGIYGSEDIDPDLVESIKQNGILIPGHCVRNDEGKLIALDGHRRKNAARAAKLTTIPVRVWQGDMPHEEQIIWIIEANRQRKKTAEQLFREGKALAEAYAEQAAKREKLRKSAENVTPPTSAESLDVGDKGESAIKAAKKLGVGKGRLRDGIKAVIAIDEAEEAGDTEKAEKIREALNKNGAATAARVADGGPVKPSKDKVAKAEKPAKSGKPGPFCDLAAGVDWCLTQCVPRPQEVARQAVRMLGKRAGLFDADAVANACKVLHTEFSRIDRECRVHAEAEMRVGSDA